MKVPSPKPIEIFCGTGGVGKTTLATARAIALTRRGVKVLLITIDPAKRLKQILKLSEVDSGTVQAISLSNILPKKQQESSTGLTFDALLMSPYATVKRVIWKDSEQNINLPGQELLQIIFRQNGGMNEIMSVVEIQHQLDHGKYDTIILDTPPGQHFIDFLESTQKIKNFFDKTYIDIFKYLGKRLHSVPGASKEDRNVLNLLVSTGVKKLLSYLERVTGPHFVEQFVNAVHVIYQSKDEFLRALKFQNRLRKEKESNWFWVTAIDHQKMQETLQIQKSATKFMHRDKYLCINKCLPDSLVSWQPSDNDDQHKAIGSVLKVMCERQQEIKSFADRHALLTVSFPDITELTPEGQISALAKCWNNGTGTEG
jgi:anion-transporting  ArsA/GET3 family ATPase